MSPTFCNWFVLLIFFKHFFFSLSKLTRLLHNQSKPRIYKYIYMYIYIVIKFRYFFFNCKKITIFKGWSCAQEQEKKTCVTGHIYNKQLASLSKLAATGSVHSMSYAKLCQYVGYSYHCTSISYLYKHIQWHIQSNNIIKPCIKLLYLNS